MTEPSINRARGANSGIAKRIPTKQAKDRVIQAIKDGLQVEDAMALVERTRHTYVEWRRSDESFKRSIDQLREMASAARRRKGEDAVVPDFPEFSATYLAHEVPLVHMRTWDLMNGREPRDMHPAMRYNRGRPNMLLINYPPDHGKSTTWSVNYATWRIISDKNSRGAIISKTSNLANQFLGAIKNRLTNPRYAELQKAFAPEGGFQGESWTQRAIYVGGRDSGEKDPTVQTLGIGGQLYGARLDWVILDDVVDNSNAHRYEEQLQWLTTEVISRLPDDGLIMVLGTRIQPVDLYKKLREMMDYNDVNPLWTYMAQPAVLDGSADSPEGWTTLWPERWPGPALARRKATLGSASRWALVFQQQDVSDEAIFPVAAVEASINKARSAGALTGGLHGDAGLPDVKPEHLYIVAGLDPATVGKTAMVVMGLDRLTQKRIVLDAFNMANCPPQKMREQVKYFTTKYGVKEWVIERNAFQRYLTQDEELRTFLYGQGCLLREHFTSCVPEDVEILTADGWKHHTDLRVGDAVASHKGFTTVREINVFDAPEKMTRIKTRLMDCDFTDQHRHLVDWIGNSRREPRMVTTDELKTNTPIRVNAEPHAGMNGDVDFAALVGWYLAEGSLTAGGGVFIAQSQANNSAKYTRIAGHLDALGWQYTPKWNGFYVFKADAKNLTRVAPGQDKHIGSVFISLWTPAARQAFIDAMIDGDGHGGGSTAFFNTRLHLLDAFEQAVALNGGTTSRTKRKHTSQFNSNHQLYAVVVRKNELTHPTKLGASEIIEGSGKVWCPTTDTGTWVARSRGHVFVTGNSNKYDEDFGVMSMAPLFLSCLDPVEGDPFRRKSGGGLIDLPNRQFSTWTDEMVEQLIVWQPNQNKRSVLTDLVMALWFCEIACKRQIEGARSAPTHHDNPFLPRRELGRRVTVRLDELAQQAFEAKAFRATRGY